MRHVQFLLGAVLVTSAAGSAWAASAVQGRMTSDGVTGRSVTGHGWDEEHIFLSPPRTAIGAGGTTLVSPPGWYSIQGTFPARTHTLFTFGFDSPIAFSYSLLDLPDGSVTVDPVELRTPAHYSVAYNASWYEWTAEPWIWGTNFYQTFVATQPHVTRLGTKLAGKSGDHYYMTLNMALYRVTDGPPSTWPQVLPTRGFYMPSGMDPIMHIAWAAYHSSDVELSVGQMYALRLWIAPGSQSTSFALVARPEDGAGYANGQLYQGDTVVPWDAYAYVSGGSDRTVCNFSPVTDFNQSALAGWSTRFGQTFRATGTSLAAAEAVYTTGVAAAPSLRVDFQLYDAVGGNPIGPPRSSNGVSMLYQARAAAAWQEGEVPTTPGNYYYLEWTPPVDGCNTWFMNENMPGNGYVNRVQKSSDLLMTIAEFTPQGPTIQLSTDQLAHVVEVGTTVTDTFTVSNRGTGTVNFGILDNADWLSCDPLGGSCTGSEQCAITVRYSPTTVGTFGGTITVSDPFSTNSPQTVTVTMIARGHPGDMDGDTDVDLEDFGKFQACLTGPGAAQNDPVCQSARLDADNDVDIADVDIFLRCLSGPGTPATPGCGN